MAYAGLIGRTLGVASLCVAGLLAPVGPTMQIAVLAAFAVGAAAAAVIDAEQQMRSGLLLGPAMIALVLTPTGPGAVVALPAAAALGFATLGADGRRRAVGAIAVPLMLSVARIGAQPSALLLAIWVALIVGSLIAEAVADETHGAPLGAAPASPGSPGAPARVRAALLVVLVSGVTGLAGAGVLRPLLDDTAWADEADDADLISERVRADADQQPDRQFGFRWPSFGGGRDEPRGETVHPGFRGELDTGLPVALHDDVVLRVRADRPRFWRATSYDQWSGRRWTSSVAFDADHTPSGPPEVAGEGAAGFAQEYRLVDGELDVFLAAPSVTGVEPGTVSDEDDSAPRATIEWGDDGSARSSDPLGAGAMWRAESTEVLVDPDALRAADPADHAFAPDFTQRFAVEHDLDDDVAALAAAITADAPTTYDKVRALEAWIAANVIYTRDIRPLPAGADAVAHLLFTSRQGFCEQIGTALVVMLRALGIPARLAVGYVPSSFDANAGEWLSRASDAHAWAEVYFPGVGWQGFDPTAGVPLAGGELERVGDPWWATGTPAVGPIGVVAVVVVVELSRRRLQGRGAPEAWLVARQRRFDAYGEALGFAWTPAATVRERGRDLVAAGLGKAEVDATVAVFEQLWFSDPERQGPLEPLQPELDRLLGVLDAQMAGSAARDGST
ncbi:MAG: transglutaminase-like domain-containing protein [Actinomycetota bacterium]